MTPEEAEAARNANPELKILGDQSKETPEPYKQDAVEDAIDGATRVGGDILGASAEASLGTAATKFLAPRVLGAAGTALGSSAALPLVAAGYTAYQTGKALDREFDLSGKIANVISGPSAPQQDGDQRRDLMKQGLDINKPIMKNPMARPGMQDYGVVSGYGELDITPGKENMYNLGPQHSMYDPNRAPAPVAAPVAAPATPTAAPTLPSASSSQAFDMPMTGMRPIDPTTGEPLSQQAIDAANRAGLELPMGNVPQAPQAPQSPRDIAVAKNEARLEALRSGGELSQDAKIMSGQMEAPEGFYNPAPATPADNVQQSTVGDDTIANFLDFKESGKPMTQDMVDKADNLAAAAGRTFDPETGYSKDFDPAIQDLYNERIAADKATQEVDQGIDPNKPAPKDTPEESKTQEQIDYEAEVQEDEQGIIDKARERGESQEYIDEMLEGVRERRAEAEAEQSLEDLKTELQIKKMRLENRKLEGELNDNGPEEVDLPKVKSLYGMMDDQGVKQDPQTGAITVTEEGFLGDSDSALAPNSSLFQQLARTPEGRYILNTRPPEINSVKDPDQSKLYEADDGRYFNYDGESWSVIVNF